MRNKCHSTNITLKNMINENRIILDHTSNKNGNISINNNKNNKSI